MLKIWEASGGTIPPSKFIWLPRGEQIVLLVYVGVCAVEQIQPAVYPVVQKKAE